MPSRQRYVVSSLPHFSILAEVRSSQVRSPQRTLVVSLTVTGAGLVLVVVLLFLLWYYKILKLTNSKTSPDDVAAAKLRKFPYRQLKRATDSFNHLQTLGKGGFGVVYKGSLPNGKEVAVKKLDLSSLQGEREFLNELSICGALESPHVVRLLGYCTHGKRVRLLVYECMQNRSLQEALFEKGYPAHLDWEKRFKIILDTAKALAFLHTECTPPIIHGDVKPSNVLLDHNFSARIADFGLARRKTEDFWVGSGRPSTSTEKPRWETPDRFRSETPDRFRHGTPELHRPKTPEREMLRRNGNNQEETISKSTAQGLLEEDKPVGEEQVVIDAFIEKITTAEGGGNSVISYKVSSSPTPQHASTHSGRSRLALTEGPENGTCHLQSPTADGLISEDTSQQMETCFSPVTATNGTEDADEWSKVNASEGGTVDDSIDAHHGRDTKGFPPGSKIAQKKKPSGKDWWWRQETSGELSVKDYVMDWIGSELWASGRSRSFKDENSGEIVAADANQPGGGEKGQRSKSRLSQIKREIDADINSAEAKRREKKGKSKNRKRREWWKDEYFAELSNKNKNSWKGRGRREKHGSGDQWKEQCSGEISGQSGDLRRIDQRSGRDRSRDKRSMEWWREYHSGDLSFSREWKPRERRRETSMGGEMPWNGADMSGDLLNRQFSGDLSRSGELVSRDVSSTTSMRGTVCYVAPEYGGSGIVPERGDIYSFGVLMLVILSGRRPIQVTTSPMKEFERANLISWARSLSHSGNVLELVDDRLQGNYDPDQAHLCISLALWCIQRVPATRPSISEVVKILSGEAQAPAFPLEPSPSPPSTRISYKSPMRTSWECFPVDTP